ncbi:MAG: hypothetical protein JW384_01453 [Nitrosomonadaceae bacterium]|nr:hypothetical protein [Nitrosomonadaceae bacterium]
MRNVKEGARDTKKGGPIAGTTVCDGAKGVWVPLFVSASITPVPSDRD